MARSADEARKAGMQTWQNQIIPTNATISNTGVSTGYQGVTAAINPAAKILFDMPEPDRKELAQRLKNAGYSVAVTGKYSDRLLSAYSSASQMAALQSQNVGRPFTVRQYLEQETASRIAEGGTGSGPRVPTVDRVISTPLQGRTIINEIFKDLLGRGPTKAEFDKYYTQVTARQKAKPVVTKYSEGATFDRTQTGGPDTQEFLYQQIAKTDEAKQNKILGLYDAFKSAIGVQ
jgi:hypothetical protein